MCGMIRFMSTPASSPAISAPFQIPAYPKPLSISQARAILPLEEFRTRLREHLLAHPGLTLAQVARQLQVSRQCVAQTVGKLNRPDCTSPLFMRLAPKTEEAKQKLPELVQRVAAGESAQRAATALGISLNRAYTAGFRSKPIKPAHGKGKTGCNCWRCRRSSHITVPLGRRASQAVHAHILDLLAWSDPYDGSRLSQATVGRLCGVGQGTVSRIARTGQ